MASIQVYDITSKRSGKTERRYRAFHRDAGGRLVGKVFRTRRDAQHWLDQEAHDRVSGTAVDRKAGRISFGVLWGEIHEATDYAPATNKVREYVWKHLEPLADRAIGDIDAAAVARVLSKVERPVMREKVRQAIGLVFRHAIAQGRVKLNPARKQVRSSTRASRERNGNGKKRYLTAEELRALVAAVPERYRALVRLMAHVGLRPGEAYALTVGQVGKSLTVDRSVDGPTKTGETRVIPLPGVVGEFLAAHINEFSTTNKTEALVFTTETGRPVRKDSFRHLLGRACARAGIETVNPNDLRHTAAAFAIGHGADVYSVQRMLGHAKASITLDVYGHLWDKSLEKLADHLDEAIREEWVS